jgi:hypothetical protein
VDCVRLVGTTALRSRLNPIYTIYGLLYTTRGLGVRHTGQAGFLAGLLGSLVAISGVLGIPLVSLTKYEIRFVC